ncbi:MAG: hypothetical protein AVDCRST_MAG35-1346, partial [uncultured Quadrisphaera sp.]
EPERERLPHGRRRHRRVGVVPAGRRPGRGHRRRHRGHPGDRLRLPAHRGRRPGAVPR